MELKLTGIALNRSKNRYRRKNDGQGSSGFDFLIEISLEFLIEAGIIFLPHKSL